MASFNLTGGTSVTTTENLIEDDSATGTDDTGSIDSTSSIATTTTKAVTIDLSQPAVSGGVVINNSGTIKTTGGSRVIDATTSNASTLAAANASITLNNAATGVISSSGGSAGAKGDLFRVSFDMPMGTIAVNNLGLMSAGTDSNDSQGIRLASVYTASSITINNGAAAVGATPANTSATITTADADAIRAGGVDPTATNSLVGAGSSVITNYGMVAAHDLDAPKAPSGSLPAQLFADNGVDISAGQSATVNNFGTISGDEGGLGSDVSDASTALTFGSNYNVTNSGTITGNNGAGIASYELVNNVVSGTATIVNSGTITGNALGYNTTYNTTTKATAKGSIVVANANGTGILVGGNASITNNVGGTISGTGAIGSNPRGGTTNVSNAINIGNGTIVNSGTISDTAGPAIVLRDTAGTSNTISNYGSITSGSSTGTAISLGAGNETLNLYTGSSVTGLIKGGTGSNIVNLGVNGSNASGTLTGVTSFGTLNVNGGAWTIGDSETYVTATTLNGGTLDLAAQFGTGSAAVTFAGTSTSAAMLSLENAAQPSTSGTFGTALANFGDNDALDLKNFAFDANTTATLTGNTLSITGTGGTENFTLNTPGATQYYAHSDNNGGTIVNDVAACYVAGTLIRTARDHAVVDVPVESLAIGDLVVTNSGEARPIRWLGHRTVNCRNCAEPWEAWPVRIAAHAFAPNKPARDLLVSPGHAICVDVVGEILVLAASLVNDATVQQVEVDEVTYWHVELDTHDVIIAENLPAESYLEMGNRGFFLENDTVAIDAGPDWVDPSRDDFCRPLVEDGPFLDAVRQRLRGQAQKEGWTLAADPFAGLHLMVDGVRIEPHTTDLSARFVVPVTAKSVWLVSSASAPRDIAAGTEDTRRLGIPVARLAIDDGLATRHAIDVDDERLNVGFHPCEGRHRWTAGQALLPRELWDGCRGLFFLRVDLAFAALPRWQAPPAVTASNDAGSLAA